MCGGRAVIVDKQIRAFDSRLRETLGVAVPDTPLNPSFVGTAARVDGSVTRTLAQYDVGTHERVGAYLLVPDHEPGAKLPAVLAIHQHAGQFHLGKSEPAGLAGEAQYHYGLELARRGYVVLCPDQLGFEDRVPVNPGELDKNAGSANERFEAIKLLLEGSSLQAKYVADLVRAVDYLASLEYVDARRIGCIGHSLGGQETLWLTWFDHRIKAAVSSCGFAMISAILRDRINHNMALCVPGMLQLGDVDFLLAAVAPRPFFFSAGRGDLIFPIDSVECIKREAGKVYRRKGASEALQYVIFEGGHGFPREIRRKAYDFLDRYLCKKFATRAIDIDPGGMLLC
jgi:dienelactone hydrolase